MLLLDEPLGALDLKLRKEMQLELKALQREVGITFVYVTHDQEEALTMSDVIVVMHEGRIQQQGRPTDLYERPVNRFVANFIGVSNPFRARVVAFDPATRRARVETDGGMTLTGDVTDPASAPAAGDGRHVAIRPERLDGRACRIGRPGRRRRLVGRSPDASTRARIWAIRPNTASAPNAPASSSPGGRTQRVPQPAGDWARAIRSSSAGTRRRTSSSSD